MINLTFLARRKTQIVPVLLTCSALIVGLPAIAKAATTEASAVPIKPLLYAAGESCNATAIRLSAIDTLGQLSKDQLGKDGPTVAAHLAPLLSKQMVCPRDHDLLRLHVLQTLGRLGPAAIDIVDDIVRFQSSDATVLEAKKTALAAILGEEVQPEAAPAVPKPQNQNVGAKEAIEIADGLKHADADIRLAAVKKVLGKPDPGFLAVIVPLMSTDPDADVRRLAADATNHLIGRMTEESQVSERNEWLVKYVEGLDSMLKREDDEVQGDEKKEEAAKPQFKQERLFALAALAAVVRDHSTTAAGATAKGRILEAQESTDRLVRALANAIDPKTGKPKEDQPKSDERNEKKRNGAPAPKVEK